MAEESIQSEGAIPPKQSPLTPAAPAAGSPLQRKPIIPRKPVLRKPGETISAPPVPVPPVAIPTAASGVAPQGIAIPREQAAKKMTARISIASATGQIPSVTVQPSSEDIKTIKLKPVPPSAMADATADNAALISQASKSKTSRISLESALNAQPELPSESPGSAPKTIRLKRPSEMDAPPATSAKPVLKPPTTQVMVPQPPHQTGQVPAGAVQPMETSPDLPENSPTRKKTIKVKRPGAGGGGGAKITLNKGEIGGSANGIGDDNLQSLTALDNLGPAVAPDKAHPIFIVAAVIAILLTITLIWVFAAQLFGPHAAIADYAIKQGPNVPNPPFAMTVE